MMRNKSMFFFIAAGMLVTIGAYYAATPFKSIHQEVTTHFGDIVGRVLDAEGQPVNGAKVYVSMVGHNSTGKLKFTLTDEKGGFVIKALMPGKYMVYGSKEEGGYLPTDSAFHADGPNIVSQVNVFDGQSTKDIIVQLGRKAAKLVGRIVDAATNQSINNATITLRRVDNPAAFLLTGPSNPEVNGKGGFKLLVPPVPFTIEVKAPGYEDWTYSSDGTSKRKDALHLAREETKKLTIALHPIK